MKDRLVCVTVTATWPKIGWIFHVFHESLSGYAEKTQQDIGQCIFVYFSLKNNVGHYLYFDRHSRIRGKHENQGVFPFQTHFSSKNGCPKVLWRENPVKICFKCTFVYFSLKNTVGTRCISIGTLGHSHSTQGPGFSWFSTSP
jgi:hypothetical protein